MPAARPVTERHFGNQFQLHPLHAPALASRHRLQALAVEAGADLAGVAQCAVVLVHGQQQRAQALARALRRGVADDDELLAAAALDLQPVIAATRHVGGGLALGDDAFQPHLAGGRHQIGRCLVERFTEPQMVVVACGHQLRQQRPAHAQRFLAQVPSADERQVEGVEHDAPGGFAVEGVLQRLEIGHALLVQHHGLAVHPGAFRWQPVTVSPSRRASSR
ncbi:hypothetical protein G6F22_016691 [Rhizopus arrhizus]|nr:hypothetical protein G6F22_016691 [Rhizopus arrhizus]